MPVKIMNVVSKKSHNTYSMVKQQPVDGCDDDCCTINKYKQQ